MKAFEQVALRPFEDEMVLHSQAFSPRLCEVIGEDQLRVALRRSMNKAGGYGLTNRGPMRLFIEMMFLYGSDFDTDPQYPWAAKILRSTEDQMQRAEQLRAATIDYQQKVSGPNATNTRKALAELATMTEQPVMSSSSDLVPTMRREMTRIFPQKVAYVGDRNLTAMIQEAIASAQRYSLPLCGYGTIVALMFAFGHGCTADPLYPWISRTLNDDKIIDPTARAKRLEKKSRTWLDHVRDRSRQGAPA